MLSLQAAAARFVDHCRYTTSLSHHTARAYAQDLHDFGQFIGSSTQIPSVTSDDVVSYIQHLLKERSLSPATAKRRLGCLKVFFRWLAESGAIPDDPLGGLRLPIRLAKRLPRLVTRDELRLLLRATSISARQSALSTTATTNLAILLMASTGMRVAELVSVALNDVDPIEGRIRVHGKGSRERTVFITDSAVLQRLALHIRARHSVGAGRCRLFANEKGQPLTTAAFRTRLRNAATTAAIERRITPHMLRHTAATLLLEEGVDIRIVQRLLGHQSIATTELYTHVADNTLRAALSRADLVRRVVVGA